MNFSWTLQNGQLVEIGPGTGIELNNPELVVGENGDPRIVVTSLKILDESTIQITERERLENGHLGEANIIQLDVSKFHGKFLVRGVEVSR